MHFVTRSIAAVLFLTLLQQCLCQTSWPGFQTKHVLDPTVYKGYLGWNRSEWNTWLQARIVSEYGTKSLCSVMAKTPNEVLSVFKKSNLSHDAGTDLFWSSIKLPTYVLKLVTDKTYDVYNCDDKYVLAGLNGQEQPKHYHGMADVPVSSGPLPNNLDKCTRLN